ncbi:MAG TPA: response regulator transcription factor [Steroidobacteraceae bacterium]|nr:response regulator transcription factor [Steroidobacteraceae bacterium]
MNTSPTQKQLRILLVDDDAELAGMMTEYFARSGHRLDCAYNGRDGLVRALEEHYDAVVLDVMLPTINGFSVLQRLRQRSRMPVIMLTARIRRDDVIAGLNGGADDYLTKPFDADELLARIQAVLRRTEAPAAGQDQPVRVFKELRIDVAAREVRSGGRLVDLTALEFDLLEMLTRVPGRVVLREEITEALLNRSNNPYDRALDVHISHLRSKLESGRALIRTIRGAGYVFTAPPDCGP